MLLMLLACATEKPLHEGEENDWLIPDTAVQPEPSGSPDPEPATEPNQPSEEPASEPDSPTDSADQVCYPDSDFSYQRCYDLVDFDPSWGSDYDYPTPYQGSTQYRAPSRFIDLETVNLNDPLAPNFSLIELMNPSKGRYSLFQVHVVEKLQELRELSGGPLNINSGYRNPDYNAQVGGAASSRHIYGDAADMYSSVLSLEELGGLCEQLNAGFIKLYETHVHCDWRYDTLDDAFYNPANSLQAAQAPSIEVELHSTADGVLWTTSEGFDEGEPLRRWSAFDENGSLIEQLTVRSYQPPSGAASVVVHVGGLVEHSISLR